MKPPSLREGILAAITEEMERDHRVILMGEDISLGGVFNVTPGLRERFGPSRVIDTPISEMAFTSAAFGAALTGLRPVVEIMFADFLALALDSLSNQAAKYRYVSGGQGTVPMVVRTAVGAGVRFGAIHSETPTPWFLGLPGIKVVAPSNAADARSLVAEAIQDDDPVIVFEHKLLYGRRDSSAGAGPAAGIGQAAVLREGTDVTLVAAMATVGTALKAADELQARGISAAVIDLRTLRPLDVDTVTKSAEATRALVAIEEGPLLGGYAAAVLASVMQHVPGARGRAVTMADSPIPFSPPLEDSSLPSVRRVVSLVTELLGG